MSKPFPKVIYVKWNSDGGSDNEPYLVAESAFKDLAEDPSVRIAAYTFTDEYDLRSVAELRRKGTKRWIQ